MITTDYFSLEMVPVPTYRCYMTFTPHPLGAIVVFARAQDDNLILLLFFISALGVYGMFWYRRRAAFKELAEKRHLNFLKDQLPQDFPAGMLANLGRWYNFGGWKSTSNVIAGMDGNDLLLAFDIRVGSGRQSYTQTWVVRRVFSPQPAPPWPSGMLFREIGNWKGAARKAAFFRSARMNMAQIEETWELLR